MMDTKAERERGEGEEGGRGGGGKFIMNKAGAN